MFKLLVALNGNEKLLKKFQDDSQKYLNNIISGEGFHDLFLATFGKENIHLLGNLISLLPLPRKRHELEIIYRKAKGNPLITNAGEKKHTKLDKELIDKRNKMKEFITEETIYYLSMHYLSSQLAILFKNLMINFSKKNHLSEITIEEIKNTETNELLFVDYLLNENVDKDLYQHIRDIINSHCEIVNGMLHIHALEIDDIEKAKIRFEDYDPDYMNICYEYYYNICNELYIRSKDLSKIKELSKVSFPTLSGDVPKYTSPKDDWRRPEELFPSLPSNQSTNQNQIPPPRLPQYNSLPIVSPISPPATFDDKINTAITQIKTQNKRKGKKKGIVLTSY